MRNYLFILFSAITTAAFANSEPSQRLEQVQTEINLLSKELNQTKTSKTELYKQLKKQSQAASQLTRELHRIDRAIEKLNAQLGQLKLQQQQYQQSHADQLQALNTQLRAAYMSAQPSYLKVLLNQQNPASLSRTSTYFRYFHQARQQQLTTISTTLETLSDNQQQLLQAQQQQQQLHHLRQQQQLALQTKNQQRQLTLQQLEKKLGAQQGRIAALREEEQSLQALFKSLSEQNHQTPSPRPQSLNTVSFQQLKGSLTWPIKGKIIASYGSSRNLGKLTWQGIMIEAPSGKEVLATAAGQVVFSDWLRGFGLLLIVDHGDKYMTLYGNNQTLLKEVGDTLQAGELIALSGDTGIRQYAGLYFEIRHKGSPTNPAKWLGKQS